MQKGFALLVPIILEIIVGLALTFSWGSSDLISASISDAESLGLPNDIGYSLGAYGNKNYKDSLSDAWNNALKAIQTADEWRITLSLNKGVVGLGWSYQSKLSEFFTGAIKASIDTYSGLNKMLLADLDELDKTGADKILSARAHKVYLDIKEILESVELKEYSIDFCFEEKVVSKVKCLTTKLHQFKDDKNAFLASRIYNLVVGDDGLLYDYSYLHKESGEAILEMKDDYESKETDFDDWYDALSEEVSLLKDDRVDLITQDVVNAVDFQEDKLVTGKGTSPAEKLYEISRALRSTKIERERAGSIYKSKDDDYVFRAMEKIDKQRLVLSDLLSQIDSIKKDLAYIDQAVQKTFSELAADKDLSNSFYIEAVKLGASAKNEKTLGKRVTGYLEAIRYLKLAKEGATEADFTYIDSVLDSLTEYGLNVTSEKAKVEKLKTIKEPELSGDVALTLDGIEEKLDLQTQGIQAKVSVLEERASYYIEALNEFKRTPGVSSLIDETKLSELDLRFEKAREKDVLSNIDSLASTYNGIIKEASKIVDGASSVYLEEFTVVSQSFSGTLSCLELTDTELLILVENPLHIELDDVKVSHNLGFLFKAGNSTDFGDSVGFVIPLIEPGKTYQKSLTGMSKLKDCTDNLTAEFLQPESVSVQELNKTEELTKLGNWLEDVCFFVECSELKKMHTALKKEKDPDFWPFLQKLDEKAGEILSNFSMIGERTKNLESLKVRFDIAVDSNVGFEADDSFLVYTENDSERVSEEFDRLKKLGGLFDTVSLSSKNATEALEDLLAKFSKDDLKKFKGDLDNLESQMNSTVGFLKLEAKSKLSRTGSEYESLNNIDMYDYLNKASDSFENGYYTRSILYSDKAHELSKSGGSGFPFEYLVIGGVISGFVLYISKKPKNKKRIEKRVLRRFED